MVQIQGAIAPFPVRIDIGAALPAPTQEQHFDLLCGEGEGGMHLPPPLGKECGSACSQCRGSTGAGERFVAAACNRGSD